MSVQFPRLPKEFPEIPLEGELPPRKKGECLRFAPEDVLTREFNQWGIAPPQEEILCECDRPLLCHPFNHARDMLFVFASHRITLHAAQYDLLLLQDSLTLLADVLHHQAEIERLHSTNHEKSEVWKQSLIGLFVARREPDKDLAQVTIPNLLRIDPDFFLRRAWVCRLLHTWWSQGEDGQDLYKLATSPLGELPDGIRYQKLLDEIKKGKIPNPVGAPPSLSAEEAKASIRASNLNATHKTRSLIYLTNALAKFRQRIRDEIPPHQVDRLRLETIAEDIISEEFLKVCKAKGLKGGEARRPKGGIAKRLAEGYYKDCVATLIENLLDGKEAI